jgi:hypothetical protein
LFWGFWTRLCLTFWSWGAKASHKGGHEEAVGQRGRKWMHPRKLAHPEGVLQERSPVMIGRTLWCRNISMATEKNRRKNRRRNTAEHDV